MDQFDDKKPLIKKLRNKYKLTVSNESTFEEVFSARLSRLNVLMFICVFSIVLIAVVGSLVVLTPLKEYIPGYPNTEVRKNIKRNAVLVDSLIVELNKRDHFFRGIKNILSGNDFDNDIHNKKDSLINYEYQNVNFQAQKADSLFRLEHENDEKYNLSLTEVSKPVALSEIYFFSPIKGIISNHFDSKSQHYGIDIVSNANERISAIADGTVTFSEWTLNTGYVIQIQHDNNLISIYKHNSELLKQAGEQVKSGEAIALLGNSGEFSSGPHLHFELWHNGHPLNPADYINFNH